METINVFLFCFTDYLESECDKAFGNKASTYIGIDEQVRILTSLNATYASSFSCSYTLRSKPGDRMMFYFKGKLVYCVTFSV